jgi:hypothetical protein
MSKSRLSWLSATLLAFIVIAPPAYAQREIHHIPPVINPDGYNPDVAQPFIDPFTFESDLQFFAPADVDRINSEITDASTGWFATYDRAYIYMTRPQAEESSVQGDFTWGNRIDLGYMTDEQHGWQISFMHIDGPNNYHLNQVERINVVLPTDQFNFPLDGINLRGGQQGGQPPAAGAQAQPGFPIRDRNNPVTNARDYILRDSINVADLSSFELNKTFRIDPLHYGSIIEPFFGFKYYSYNDYFENDRYSRFDTLTGLLVYSTDAFGFPPPPPIANIGIEQFDSLRAQFENHMFGGQIGTRWFKQKSRWNLSGDVRAFAVQNFQSFTTTFDTERTHYSSGTGNPTVQAVFNQSTINSGHSSEFVFGTEVRAEAAYELTRYIQLRAGLQFIEFARGIGRGINLIQNDQDVTMAGATFGVTVNR